MPIPSFVAKVNRAFTNRVMILLTRWPPFAALRHVGRLTGREYRIPINVFPAGEGFIFALTYGPDTDWLKNVMAAGRATLEYRGVDLELVRPRLVARQEAASFLPAPVRGILHTLRVDTFLIMDSKDASD